MGAPNRIECSGVLHPKLVQAAAMVLFLIAGKAEAVFRTVPPGLSQGRAQHSVTQLTDGRILIAGGISSSGVLSSVEVFDPAMGTSTNLAMNAPRYYHTATLLRSGMVLIAGGLGTGNVASSTAEIFDPATNEFTPTTTRGGGPMAQSRYGHTANLMLDGRVLIAGGSDLTTPRTSMELFDPATNTFSTLTAALASGRVHHGGATLPNGRILFSGGSNGLVGMNTAELFDPFDNSVVTLTMAGGPRLGHTSTVLHDGKLLITGGSTASVTLNSAEVFRYQDNSFALVAQPMTTPRSTHRATLLPNGTVLLTGGLNGGTPLNSAEIFNPAGGTDGQFTATSAMNSARSAHGSVLLPSGDVLLVGGDNGTSARSATMELYRTQPGGLIVLPRMNFRRLDHTSTLLPDGRVLIAGGRFWNATAYDPLQAVEIFDPATGAFTRAGFMTTPRSRHTATLLPGGRVLITGGSTIGAVDSAELYDPVTGRFTRTGTMTRARSGHTATLLPSGRVLIVGGAPTPVPSEVYDPALGTFVQIGGSTLEPRSGHRATLLKDGRVLISGGSSAGSPTMELFDPASGTFVYSAATTSAPRWRHSAARLPSGTVLLVGSESGTGQLADEYDPVTDRVFSFSILCGRRYPTAVALPSGIVAVIGGCAGSLLTEVLEPVSRTLWATGAGPTTLGATAATALLDGRVLITGGLESSAPDSDFAGLVDVRRVVAAERRPVVNPVPPVCQPASVTVGGSAFASGGVEGSSGNWQSSAANAPLLRLQRLDDSRIRHLPLRNWTNNTLLATFADLPVGTYRLSVVGSGIPSVEQLAVVGTTSNPPVLGNYPNASVISGGSTTVQPSPSPVYFDTTTDTQVSIAGGFGGLAWIDPSTGQVTIADATPVGTYTATVTARTLCSGIQTRSFSVTVTPLAAPSITASSNGTSVTVAWGAVQGAVRYDVYRREQPGPMVSIGSSTTLSFADTSVLAQKAYVYQVKAVDSFGMSSEFSNLDLSTNVHWTDRPLVPGVTPIRAIHMFELRSAVNAVRSAAGLSPFGFSDPTLTGSVRSMHFSELRSALAEARAAIGVPATSFPTPIAPGEIIRAAAVDELRAGVE